MPPTIRGKPLKSAFFSRTSAGPPAADKILSTVDISSDSFVLTADKNRIPLTISKLRERNLFSELQIACASEHLDSGQGFGRRAMESPRREEVLCSLDDETWVDKAL